MIRVAENIWIGNSDDEINADLKKDNITAILNVAQDLMERRGWIHGIEYMHVGLIDGPGNSLSAYYTATLALCTLLQRNESQQKVLVCCHDGSRALAVVLMSMNLVCNAEWDHLLELLRERVDEELPKIHNAHKIAFDQMKCGTIKELLP